MSVHLVYVTASSMEEAERIGGRLVEEGLAACVNILGEIQSIYRWNESVERGSEVAFLAKTRSDRVEALTARVVELHSYECPCVVSTPTGFIHPPFAAWIEGETAG